jgi:hypothetical protein
MSEQERDRLHDPADEDSERSKDDTESTEEEADFEGHRLNNPERKSELGHERKSEL